MMHKSTRTAKQEVLRNFMETTIAQAAKEVCAERGYQRATLEEIAQRASMSKEPGKAWSVVAALWWRIYETDIEHGTARRHGPQAYR